MLSMTGAGAREPIRPDWTLGKLKERFPGVELAMFAFFGVGSRERSGFSASETLADLLRRHLVFDASTACARLDALASEDWDNEISPQELAQGLKNDQISVLDARSHEDHQRCHLSGSVILSAPSVALLRTRPERSVVVVCNDGSQSPAASRHLRGLGLRASHLSGGLQAWSIESDESFPINYPIVETEGRWHLMADGRTLRFRRKAPANVGWRIWPRATLLGQSKLQALAQSMPGLEAVLITPRSFAARGDLGNLHAAALALSPWVREDLIWSDGGEISDQSEELQNLQRVLSQEAPKILQSHKGTVEIESYQDRVLTLRLGGGCSGCASASVTTQRELAAALYREVPLLDRIQNAP